VLVEKLANKVNAPGDTPEAHLGAVVGRADEVALHGIRLVTALGLAAMSTRTGVDYSTRTPGFDGGVPEDLDDIEATVERLDGHGSKEKNPVVWYSHQCTPANHHSRCTSTANKIALRWSANPLVHTSIISLPLVLLQKKPPRPWRTKGKNHARRTASHQRSERSKSNLLFSLLSLDLDYNLVIHLSLISASTYCRRTFLAPKRSLSTSAPTP
jgi:hypothetical protein